MDVGGDAGGRCGDPPSPSSAEANEEFVRRMAREGLIHRVVDHSIIYEVVQDSLGPVGRCTCRGRFGTGFQPFKDLDLLARRRARFWEGSAWSSSQRLAPVRWNGLAPAALARFFWRQPHRRDFI